MQGTASSSRKSQNIIIKPNHLSPQQLSVPVASDWMVYKDIGCKKRAG